MRTRSFESSDLDRLLQLTISTFRPFFVDSFPGYVGAAIAANEAGDWHNDYRRQWDGLHDPSSNKYVIVAENEGQPVGFLAWSMNPDARRAEIDILAVDAVHRRSRIASALCVDAFAEMKRLGAEVVELGTGGDAFHAPARAFYDSLGMTAFPQARYFMTL
jgi:ribosomal protein S18 acetylase RimI-like enzyme